MQSVTENGYVAVYNGKSNDKDPESARTTGHRASALRRFDNNFVKSLIRVTTDQEDRVLLQAGHRRATVPTSARSDDQKASATDASFAEQLEALAVQGQTACHR